MNSLNILKEYLLSRSNLEEIVPFDKFKRFFPKTILEHLAQKLYDELAFQKSVVLRCLDEEIENLFDVPLDSASRQFDIPASKYSLSDTVDSLNTVRDISMSQLNLLNNSILNVYEEVDIGIGKIDDVQNDVLPKELLDATEESIDKCSSNILHI